MCRVLLGSEFLTEIAPERELDAHAPPRQRRAARLQRTPLPGLFARRLAQKGPSSPVLS